MNYKLETSLSPELEKYRAKIEATIKPYIEITIENNNSVNWWQSKFGGLPYLPKEFEYPKTPNDKYLFLLAQINFAEVPYLEGFPNQGILQFYIGDDELYGEEFYDSINLDNPIVEARFRSLYFPQPDLNIENIIDNYNFLPKPEYFPVDGCCSLQFAKRYAPISMSDDRFTKILGEDFKNLLRKDNKLYDEYLKISLSYHHKIGGYPDFLQCAVRNFADPEYDQDPDILLFQMVGDDNDVIYIDWALGGIAHFFILQSELKILDFSNVFYEWQR